MAVGVRAKDGIEIPRYPGDSSHYCCRQEGSLAHCRPSHPDPRISRSGYAFATPGNLLGYKVDRQLIQKPQTS